MKKSYLQKSNAALVKKVAQELGFSYIGISKADFLEEDAPRLEQWLNKGMHGKMGYLAKHFDKRLDPTKLVPGAKSVISLMCNYYPPKDLTNQLGFKIAKYAYGEDYHFVIKRKLKAMITTLQEKIGQIEGRVFVDSAPVMERTWAAKSGLGWVGKNSLLLNKQAGSFYFLAEIISDLALEPDGPIKDYCGTCTRCIDACPTNAIPQPYVVDGSKCISYLTIELKEAIPQDFKGQFNDWIFGCDICQDVCPWNNFSKPHSNEAFLPNSALTQMNKEKWEELTEEVFKAIFRHSAVKRTKYTGLKRNIEYVKQKGL